tara:strand:- start:8 stop:1054 length:1047 start_codon:yes stop_codon:yes gene_type:complete
MSNLNSYQDSIKDFFCEYDIEFRKDILKKDWDNMIEKNCSYFPYEFSSSSIDYQIEYQKNLLESIQDLSFILSLNNQKYCFFYFSLITKKNKPYLISFNGPHANSIVSPLISKHITRTIEKKIIKIFYNYLITLKKKNFNQIIIRESQCENKSLSFFGNTLLSNNFNLNLLFISYLNITDIIYYQTNIRKSYKSLINTTLKKISYSIIDYDCKELYLIKDLHKEISGKQTRSDKTWSMQFEEIINKGGFVINTYINKKICSASMFLYSCDEVIYASGAYKDIDKLYLGHASQDIAIRKIISLNKRWYRIGEMPYSFYKMDHHSNKMKNIAKFKNGFSSDTIPTYIYND